MTPPIPDGWKPVLAGETSKPYYQNLQAFLVQERAKYTVFPPEADVFNALKFTPFDVCARADPGAGPISR